MVLIHRLSKLFTADMHAVLDRLEEPEILLKQAIRDMRSALYSSKAQLQALHLERNRLHGLREQAHNSVTRLSGELDVCFSASQETLARSVIRRRLAAERGAQGLDRRLADLDQAHAELVETVELQEVDLATLEQKAQVLGSAPDQVGPSSTVIAGQDAMTVTEDDVEVAFLAERHKRAVAAGEQS